MLIILTKELIKEIKQTETPFYILPNKEIIYNKEIFLDLVNVYNIKYIKLEKEYFKLISDKDCIYYKYAPELLKNFFKE